MVHPLRETTRRSHQMPFGTECLPDESVRFHLWAPDAQQVDLVLNQGAKTVAMQADENGWFRLTCPDAKAGDPYQFCVDGDLKVPDPASRHQLNDVHGPSVIVDPGAFSWKDTDWTGRPWEETVLYELLVGSFSPEGTFKGVEARLDALAVLGITAIELLPLADFPGARNWGYDGVLPFAPDARYGTPEDLKSLVQAAHQRNMMVFLDVVYNHFGPEGNYLWCYAKSFFNQAYETPWGGAINYDGAGSETVRSFFIHNALYWLEEYHLDGLRLDAVHAIYDYGQPHILSALAEAVEEGPGRHRHVHLVLENDANQSAFLERTLDPQSQKSVPQWYVAQWNDDIHHCLHVLTSGETGGYYGDYDKEPHALLGRCLTQGFAYQGERSAHRGGEIRGEPSDHLPPTAFVSFLQNHDQVGNRAFGDRITAFSQPERVRVAISIYLLAPSIPMLFMGEEWGSQQPFPFFCDFGPDLAQAVTEGRRKEFAQFPEFRDPANQSRIPDPNAVSTFESAVLDWQAKDSPAHRSWYDLYQRLLAARHQWIVPLLKLPGPPPQATCTPIDPSALLVQWRWETGQTLTLLANFGEAVSCTLPPDVPQGSSQVLDASSPTAWPQAQAGTLEKYAVLWLLA